MSAPSTTRVLWRDPSKLIGNAWVLLPLGLSLSTCLIGLPVAMRALKILTRMVTANALELRDRPGPRDPEKTFAGSTAFVLVLVFWATMLAASVVAEHLTEGLGEGVQLAAVLVAGPASAIGLGAALASLLYAPILAVAGEAGFFAPFGRSFELAAARGAGPSLRTGATVGAVYAAFGLAFALGGSFLGAGVDRASPAMLCGPLGVAFATPRVLAMLANVWADADVARPATEPASQARLRGLAWMIAPALIAVAAAFLVTAAVPLPMQRGASPAPQQRGLHPEMLGRPIREGRLPGTSVRVRAEGRGVVVEADDGGGAGAIDADFPTYDAWIFVDQRTRGGEPVPEYRVAVSDGTHWAWTVVDDDGVRLDDSLADRTLGRLGRVGSAGLAIGALLLLFLTFTVGVELGSARGLQAPALLAGERESGALAALEGTLRLGEGSRLLYTPPPAWAALLGADRARLRVEGEAWVEAADGAIRFRLPDAPVPVIGGGEPDDWGGVHVVLLSRFPSSGVAGPRQASAAWPEDGALTLGSRSDAREVLTQRAVRRAARVALPMLAGFGVAVAALLIAI